MSEIRLPFIQYYIKSSKTIDFSWSIDTGTLTRHTAIVLKFDDKPRFTVDFSASSPSGTAKVFNHLAGALQLAVSFPGTAIRTGLYVTPFKRIRPKHFDFGLYIDLVKFLCSLLFHVFCHVMQC